MKISIEISPAGTIAFTVNGRVDLETNQLQALIARLLPEDRSLRSFPPQPREQQPLRLAYTVQETSALLGVSTATVYRLLHRGLLKANKSLRCKLIAKREIDRFLSENT